jgi:predicted nucleotidyltransferase
MKTMNNTFVAGYHKHSVSSKFDNKISSIRQLILESVDNTIINKIYLFGSYAYGNPNEDSDIDLCVVVNDDIDKLDAYMKIIGNLTDNNIIPCDLIVCHAKMFFNVENPKSIENTIIKEGKVLYG